MVFASRPRRERPARYQPAVAEVSPDPAERTPSPDAPAAEQSLDRGAPQVGVNSQPGEVANPRELPDFAVFFVPPTSYTKGALGDWNAPLNDADTDQLARVFLRGLASPFNRADEVWAPKYRQAAVGAFLTDREEATRAIDAAYADVEQAFRYFVESVGPDKPIVLAGHSQGAAHVLRLLRDVVAGTDLEPRIAAVYAPGWPISLAHDLPALPLPLAHRPASPPASSATSASRTTAIRPATHALQPDAGSRWSAHAAPRTRCSASIR